MKLKFKQFRKPIRISFFHPVKLNTSQSVRKIPLNNLTWPQASLRFPRMNPFGDKDRDGKLNMFDCKPFDKKKHSKLLREEIRNRLNLNDPEKEITKKKIYDYMEEFEKKHKNLNSERRNYPMFKKTFKTITTEDIVKYFEKNPDLIQTAEQVKWGSLRPEQGLMNREAEYMSDKYEKDGKIIRVKPDTIGIASALKKKKADIGQSIKHEMKHLKDDLEGHYEGVYNHPGKYGISKEHKKEYLAAEREKRAYVYETEPLERDIAKEAGPKSEVLQSLDPDDTKSIEIKDED